MPVFVSRGKKFRQRLLFLLIYVECVLCDTNSSGLRLKVRHTVNKKENKKSMQDYEL